MAGGRVGVYLIERIPYQVQDLVITPNTGPTLYFYSEKEKEVAISVLERSPLSQYLQFV